MSILPFVANDASLIIKTRPLIRTLRFRITKTQCTVIIGPNGAGKSLTLALMHGLLKPSAGAMRWNGNHAHDATVHQAMLFQTPCMLNRSVLHNLTFALAAKTRLPYAARKRQALTMLKSANLAQHAHADAPTLSAGQKQVVALLRAIITKPQVLFLDEPTANLDLNSTKHMERIIQTLKRQKISIVMTTHDINQGRRLADEVLFIHEGMLLEQTPAPQFFAKPQSRAARQFIKGELP